MKKKLIGIILIILVLFSLILSPTAVAFEPTGVDLHAEAVLLASMDTDEIIYSKNADQRMYPASLTKIISAIVVLKNTEDLDSEILTVSKTALRLISGTGSSVVGLLEGEKITARQALYGLLVCSGGDVSYVIAEHYGGNVEGFVDMMNQEAQQLGLTGTHFANPHGLHDDDHYSTAQDLLKLARAAMEYPEFMKIVKTTRYKMAATNLHKERTLITTNFLQDISTAYYYKYASGIKTGFTDEAGRCLIATASKDGYNYICVLLKSPNKKNSEGITIRYEFTDAKNLFEWAFKNLEYKSAVTVQKAIGEIKVTGSFDADHVTLRPAKDFTTILPKGADDSTITVIPHYKSETIKAPITKGDVLGTADVFYGESLLGTIDLVATESVKASRIMQIWETICNFFRSKTFYVILIVILMIIVLFLIYIVYLNRERRKHRRKVSYRPLRSSDIKGKHE